MTAALTKAEAAAILKVSPATLDRRIKAGVIQTIPHMGRLVRIAPAELERVMNERMSA